MGGTVPPATARVVIPEEDRGRLGLLPGRDALPAYSDRVPCGSCGTDAPPGARFCSTCGAPLAKSDTERRIVTVLFSDIVGFTSLSERLDPEQVKQQVDRCFERLTIDIASFGGVVDKVMGDGIIALFGAPFAHEDDAERAVRAGLKMQQTLAAMGSELQTPFRMRVGVNTGEVLVGSSSSGRDYTAMGDVVNSAARLQTVAEPGRVLVGEATYNTTREAISYHSLGQVEVKGRSEALGAWEALGAIRPPGARTRRTVNFVGREAELRLLESQARVAFDLAQAQIATVIGEAGTGKTRLVEEAAARLVATDEIRVLEGRCVPYGEANVWWPAAEMMRHLLGVARETSDADIRPIVDAALDGLLGSDAADRDRLSTAVLHMFGYETPLRGGDRFRNREEVTLVVTRLIEAELARRPVVVVLSDMHWAGEAVWELVRHLLAELLRSRLMVMVTARRSETSEVIEGRFGSLRLELGPLDENASRRLIAELGVDTGREQLDELVRRSGGNPFFLEELAGLMAADESTGETTAAEPRRGEVGSLDRIPDTLRGILAARLDRLDPEPRRVLEHASVLGRSGTRKTLGVMLEHSNPEADFDNALLQLEEAELLTLTPSRFEFVSDLIREVAYATVTKTVRAQCHAEIARYLETAHPPPIRNSTAVSIARHYRAAADLVNDLPTLEGVDVVEVTGGALRWLDEAGWRALAAGEPREAEHWFAGVLQLSGDSVTTANGLFGRAKARCELRDVSGTRADLDRLETLVQHDPVLGAKALMVRGDINQKAGEFDRAAAELREAADRLDALHQPADHALALRLLGITEMSRGDETMALQALTSSRAVAAAAGIRREEAWALQNLAWFAFRSGRVAEASGFVTEAEKIFSELDDRGGLAWTRSVEAWVAFHGGRWDRARELVAEILPETRRRGDAFAETVMLSLETSMALWSGEAFRAVELAREAQAVAERADDFTLAVQARALEGRALISCGRVAEGLAALEQAFSLADRAGGDESRRIAVISNCAASARLGDAERAIRWAARFEGTHKDLTVVGESDLSVSLALALLQRGSVDEAASQISWIDSFESEHASMYAEAVGAIVAAAQGDTASSESKAEVVLAGRSTYLDRLLARLALTAVANRLADTELLDARLAMARDHLAKTDDLVSPLFVELVAAICGRGSLVEAEDALRAMGVDPQGWKTAWSLAADVESVPGSVGRSDG